MNTNIIYCGDNLEVLSKYIPDESVDLIYIDPPFNSSRNYDVFWGEAQERRAFEDRFGDVTTYIDWMRPRIRELYRVLKPTGSFYYHCDAHASHYIKVELDRIFSANNFQNELIWYYRGGGVSHKRFARRHDTIFFYSKGKTWIFNADAVRTPYSKESMERLRYKAKAFRGKRTYDNYSPNPQGKHPDDVLFIQPTMPSSKERLGYPTQKPLALLERIISASSNKDSVILDAFCGSGTTLEASGKLGRRWIGIDFSPTACRIMSKRLSDRLGLRESTDFQVLDIL